MGSKIIDSDSRTEAQPKHKDQTALDSVTLRGPSPSGVSSETERLHISATLIVTVDFSQCFFEMFFIFLFSQQRLHIASSIHIIIDKCLSVF